MGKPELILDSVYNDGVSATALPSVFVFKIGDKYRMVYYGLDKDNVGHVFVAESSDGIHFTSEDVTDLIDVEDRDCDKGKDLEWRRFEDKYFGKIRNGGNL